MLRRIGFVIGVAAAVVAFASAPAPVAGADCAPNDTICRQLQDAKQSQATANQKLQGIQQSLSDAQVKAGQTLAVLHDLEAQISAQQAKIAQTQSRLASTDRQITSTEAEITRQQARLDQRKQLLAQRVRTMDQHGTADYMELVVTSRNFSELVDRIVLMQTIIESDQKLLDSLKQQRDQIKQLRQQLQGQHDQQTVMLKQQRDQQAQVQQTRTTQQQTLDYYHQLEVQLDGQRQVAAAEKARVDALVTQLQAQFDEQGRAAGGGTGTFGWPERGRITQMFGCTDFVLEPFDPNCATRHFHSGLDIGAPQGTPVGSADNGVVSFVNHGSTGYGNYVIVTHGNGYSTLYGHLLLTSVSVGQAVQRGQQIGLEGSTGFSTGPHLHFEIRLNGAYKDPLAFLAG